MDFLRKKALFQMFDWFFITQLASNLIQMQDSGDTIKYMLPSAHHCCNLPSVFTKYDKKAFSFVLVELCIFEVMILCITRYIQCLPTFIYFY